jgi:3',5'-cyclic AMP phosphodiesterase CpdA
MRTLVHLSDLHFGSIRDTAVTPLIECVARIQPDVVAVSGDLTQRARREQFRAARDFLAQLSAPKVVVPGNHDVPLYNPLARLRRLMRYRRYIVDDLEPFYCNGDMAVLGINTARSLAFKGGRINAAQVARAKARLGGLPDKVAKIIVTHHPFDLPPGCGRKILVGRGRMAIRALNECKIDLFLAGHFHVSGAAPTTFEIPVDGYSSLIVQAGTAISTRTRRELNTFNVIRFALPDLSVERIEWNPDNAAFAVAATEHFVRGANGWALKRLDIGAGEGLPL